MELTGATHSFENTQMPPVRTEVRWLKPFGVDREATFFC
jgi:hypothetical protein